MFGQLPKLFDRNFAIANFLPVAIFAVLVFGVFSAFGLRDLATLMSRDLLVGTTTILLATWLASVGLLLLNRDIIRFLEGYGDLNPCRLLAAVERHRFRSMNRQVMDLRETRKKLRTAGQTEDAKLERRWLRLRQMQAWRFPHREDLLLPTALGNTIRAFEVYPTVLYGLDAIHGWPRLTAVLPEHFLEAIGDAKVKVDAWLNVCVLACLFVLFFLWFVWDGPGIDPIFWLVPVAAATVAMYAYWRSVKAAAGWGEWVKAAFDLYQDDLAKALGYDSPTDLEQRRQFWTQISQAMIYRHPDSLAQAADIVRAAKMPEQ